MEISIEELKKLNHSIVDEINHEKEPLDLFKTCVSISANLLSYKADFKDNQAAQYYYETFLLDIVKAVLKSKHYKNEDAIVDLGNNLSVLFVSEVLKDNQDLGYIMQYILDPEMSFYRNFRLLKVPPNSIQCPGNEHEDWRSKLKVGDSIEVLKTENDAILLTGWTTGIVKAISAENGVEIELDGINEGPLTVQLNSDKISPYGMHTGGNSWREELKIENLVDCIDPMGAWYQSTILDIKNKEDKKLVVMIKIGFRNYETDGSKKDEEGREYNGWNSKYDEWINLYSIRIQKFGTIAKLGSIGCNKILDSDESETIEDTSDILINSTEENEIYAILRSNKPKSQPIVDMLNNFGRKGGFDNVLKGLEDQESFCEYGMAFHYLIDIFYYMIEMLAGVSDLLHRKFAQSFLPEFAKLFINYFNSLPDPKIRKMKKERLEKILSDLNKCLSRVYTVIEKHKILEYFKLNMLTRFIKSNYLQLRIDGLKSVNTIIVSAIKQQCREITEDYLLDWIQKEKILEELIGARKHQQILQRSSTLLQFACYRSVASNEVLEGLWELTKDELLRKDLCKVLGEISLPLDSAELEFFANKIVSMEPEYMCEEALNIIFESHKNSKKTNEQSLKYADIMAKIAFSGKYSLEISENSLYKYSEMVSTLNYNPYKKDILLYNIKEMIMQNNCVVLSLKLIRGLLNQCAEEATAGITITRSDVINYLMTEADLVQAFFGNLEWYYNTTKGKQEDKICVDRYNHTDNMTERIDFLIYLLTNSISTCRLPIKYYYKLWSIFYESPVSTGDSELLFIFLKGITENPILYSRNFDEEEAKKLFTEKIGSIDADYEKVTLKALLCIVQFFNLINENKGYLRFVQDCSNLFDVQSKVDPSKLYGVEVFWKIVQEANDEEVMEKCCDFLNKLYTQVAENLDANAIKNSFIETYLDRLAKTIEDPKALEKNKLKKMIKLINDMICESEKHGTGGIKSHISLIKGKIINMLIKNYLTLNRGMIENFEIEIFSNVTIWEFKLEIGKYLECNPECMEINIDSKDIKDTDHGRTLEEFSNHNFGFTNVNRKEMPEVPKVPLLDKENNLTEPIKRALLEIFNKFARNGKMDLEGIVNFMKITAELTEISGNAKQVKDVLKNFDKDRDGCLSLEEFLCFYKTSLLSDKEDVVRKNLFVHGFRNDLKGINEIPLTVVDVSGLPRHILSQHPKSFELLFRALDKWGSKVEFVWELIKRLTTNEQVFTKIKNFEVGIKWEDVIDTKSSFKLLYYMQIIYSFLETNNSDKWKQEFVTQTGFDFLVKLFVGNYLPLDTLLMKKYEKITLELLMLILFNFTKFAAFSLNANLHAIHINYLKIISERKGIEKPKSDIQSIELLKANLSTIFFPRGFNEEERKVPKQVLNELQAKIILDNITGKEVWKRAFNIIAELSLENISLDDEDKRLLKTSIQLLFITLILDRSIFPLVKAYSFNNVSFDKLILFGLLKVEAEQIRVSLCCEIFFLCLFYKDIEGEDNPLTYFMNLVMHLIPQTESKKCAEFFKLCFYLINTHYQNANANKSFDVNKFIQVIMTALRKGQVTEEENLQTQTVGFISCLRRILTYEPSLKQAVALKEGLLAELFCNCLFPSKDKLGTQKCQDRETQKAAYRLIKVLCKGNTKVLSIFYDEYLEPILSDLELDTSWEYAPADECRSKFGYVGIKNLGCICYMNSILQQFYMVPSFRYGILSVEDNTMDEDGEEDVLYQLRRMFAFLECSQKQFYNPKKFCHAYKDLDGNPTNTSMQQDAHEFLNMAFERMEDAIAKTSQKFLISGIFGGKMCSQLICKGGCGSVRKNSEAFYNLSVEVKEFKTLADSLSKFFAGDTISDYMCDKCNKRVDVVKRTSIAQLPNVLIIHLQRIIFNFDTMRNDKINSRLEFPKDLSMEPYTTEGMENAGKDSSKDASYYRYKLAGVVVHVGTAEAGHYYSYINTNRKRFKEDKERDLFQSEKDLWLEYNDSRILSFKYNSSINNSIEKLEEECFGNFSAVNDTSDRNAYMLIYERELKLPIKKDVEGNEANLAAAVEFTADTKPVIGQIYCTPSKDECFTHTDFYDVQPIVPTNLQNLVKEDNTKFLLDRQIYSIEFFKFLDKFFVEMKSNLHTFTGKDKENVEKNLNNLAKKAIFDLLVHAFHNTSMKDFVKHFIELLRESGEVLKLFSDFIDSEFENEIKKILCKCLYKSTREVIGDLISKTVLIATSSQSSCDLVPYGTRIIDLFINGIDENLAKSWLRFEQYFETLLSIVKDANSNIQSYMVNARVVRILVDFYLETDSPFYDKEKPRKEMGNKNANPLFSQLVELVCILGISSDLSFIQPQDKDLRPKLDMPPALLDLQKEEKQALVCSAFLNKTILNQYSTATFAKMVAFCCYDNEKYSRTVLRSVLAGINDSVSQNFTNHFLVLNALFALEDQLQSKRLEWVFGASSLRIQFKHLKQTGNTYEQLNLGLQLMTSMRDKVHLYASPIVYKIKCESLLNFAWDNRKKIEISMIASLISSMHKLPAVFKYILKMPSPTYKFDKYYDWIKQTMNNYRPDPSFMYCFKQQECVREESMKAIFELDKQWAKLKEEGSGSFINSDPYMIGSTLGENEIMKHTKDNVDVIVSELITECYESKPIGVYNAAIPVDYFKVEEGKKVEAKKQSLKLISTEASALKIEVRNSNVIVKLHR